ncbi:hypothetical protein CLIB1423_27S01068 [[Candida] railenensis]|uniref:Uncharacterized protein n=1 Tax=[Candida] railenensis TaxID=45579 RepID=A0A9P0W1C6_9ASCO|nr:hypothetical protein CLIB1423_27S01068 [[Candida] railenensis]
MKVNPFYLFALFTFAASSEPNLGSELRFNQASQPIRLFNYHSWDDVPLSVFKDKDVAISLEYEESTILHHSSLNTASRSIPNGSFNFEFHNNNDKEVRDSAEDHYWYEFKTKNIRRFTDKMRPITGCLNQQHGDGGSLVGTFTKEFGKTSSFDLAFGYTFNDTIKVGLDYIYSVSSSIVLETSYSCAVPANSTGQVFIQPKLLRYEEPKYRQITVHWNSPWYNPIVKEPVGLVIDDWTTTDTFEIVNFNSKPVYKCVIDPQLLECSSDIYGDNWVTEFT